MGNQNCVTRAGIADSDAKRIAQVLKMEEGRRIHKGLAVLGVDEALINQKTSTAHTEALRGHNKAQILANRIADVLEGKDRSVAETCLKSARQREGMVSLVLLALMASHGIDFTAWLILQDHVGHIDIPGGEHANIMSDDTPDGAVLDAHVHFGDNRYRVPAGWIEVPVGRVPDTVMTAATGRPLSSLISSPFLDGFGFTITDIRYEDGLVEIAYHDPRAAIAFKDLTAELLAPDSQAVGRIHNLARIAAQVDAQRQSRRTRRLQKGTATSTMSNMTTTA